MKKFVLSFVVLLLCSVSKAQLVHDSTYQYVIERNQIDTTYMFGKWTEEGEQESHIRYLGIIKSDDKTYRILKSTVYWGLSKRATSRLLVYSDKNNPLGYYQLSLVSHLPKNIENNLLIFFPTNGKDKEKVTKLDFENGIPNQFFLENSQGEGDIYFFTSKK